MAAVEVSESAIVRVTRVKRGRVVNRPRKDSVIRERALRGGTARRGRAGYDCALTQSRGLWSLSAPFAPVRRRGDLGQRPEFGFRRRRGRMNNRRYVAVHRARGVARFCGLFLRNEITPSL